MQGRPMLVSRGLLCVSPLLGEPVLARQPAAPTAPCRQVAVIRPEVGLRTPMFGATE